MKYPHCSRTGFTLIELSIVLVIIGLIVGGVLVGRDLIKAAETRATIADVEKLKTAVNTFRAKYSCLPGDCSRATKFFGTAAVCPTPDDAGTCDGDGNESYIPLPNESYWAIDQLVRAGLWAATAPGYEITIRGLIKPAYGLIFTNDPFAYGLAPINGHNGTTISLVSMAQACISGSAVSAVSGQAIDIKTDDGNASTGIAYGINSNVPAPPAGGCSAAAPACLNGANDYDVLNEDARCRMIIY